MLVVLAVVLPLVLPAPVAPAAMAVVLLAGHLAAVVEVLEGILAVRGSPGGWAPSNSAAPALAVVAVVAVLAAATAAQEIPGPRCFKLATAAVEEVGVPQAEMLDQMDLLLQMLMLDNQQLLAHHQELSLLQQQHIQSL